MPKYPWQCSKAQKARYMEFDKLTQPTDDWGCEKLPSAIRLNNALPFSDSLLACAFPRQIEKATGFTTHKTWPAGSQPKLHDRFGGGSRTPPSPPHPQCQRAGRRPWRSQYWASALRCIFILFILIEGKLASPIHPHIPSIVIRQAVPDRFGNTGNEPAPIASQPPPRLATPTLSPTASANPSVPSTANIPTFTTTGTSTPPLPSSFTPPNGNANRPPGEVENNPFAPLTLTSPRPSLSPGAIAGLAGAGFVLLCILSALGFWLYRNRPSANVEEIPIRRSKLSSRLGFRLFGEGGVLSRSGSRNESRSGLRKDSDDSNDGQEKEVQRKGWLSKRDISRPQPVKGVWVENGLLGVPNPVFLQEARGRGQDTVAPWAPNEGEGRVGPGRPKSAEPLGRLSGMGLGMGYLK